MRNNLTWNVYRENFNTRKIEKYNVLNSGIIEEIKNRTKNIYDLEKFAEEVKQILMNYFWCRSEHEVIITDWPTHISLKELDRLNDEVKEYNNKYNKLPLSVTVNLNVEEKIDIYDQIYLNWDIFIKYLYENLKSTN
jgi:hypothetical protein